VNAVRSFLNFLWEFVVGDDWRIAVGVVIALGVTAAVATTSVPAWWILPVAVLLLLGASVWHAASAKG
jgi:tryptophan-rich sensory protein